MAESGEQGYARQVAEMIDVILGDPATTLTNNKSYELARAYLALEAELAERSQAFERAAADSVRLEEENGRYREALEEIAYRRGGLAELAANMRGTARAALDAGDGAQAVAPKDSGSPDSGSAGESG